ncbi:glycosyltransferase family 9 protein [Saccharomonospora xinjiangensis]|uniref:ADP-heptose:LPS heptosyltransferase n=1 Tax=Saccharomonospora xinjiangensis XJ-54 TaxID=882086 RepID=I0UYZ9_9PSEU|nr:glycosyltransferase family 9 protein [Saccharomonospora xinjiangensis]EID53102.1 ADP-heptose:LPS heptosyltransferase [Saccharomonospora xinjiangensis XJ-54]
MAVTLVLRALGLGDVLTAVPALRALHGARPHDRLVLAAPAPMAPLVPLLVPRPAAVELLPTPGLAALPSSPALPALPPIDLAVNLHGRGPQSIADLAATHPLRMITHRHPDHPRFEGPEWRDDLHEVHRWCALLDFYGIPADPTDLELLSPPLPSPAPGAVVIHPGAKSAARRWPPDRFATVARALADDLSGTGRPVLVTGSAGERGLATDVAVAAGLGPDAVFAGHDLAELAALVAGAALVVCGDTGVGHLATAFGTPSVLLFGPTPPEEWGPPEGRTPHVVLWAGTSGDPHATTPDAGLLRLTAPAVLDAARTLLAGGEPCRNAWKSETVSPSASSAPATSD